MTRAFSWQKILVINLLIFYPLSPLKSDFSYYHLKKAFCPSYLGTSSLPFQLCLFSIETCILSLVKQITSPGWVHDTGARAWALWEDPEESGGEGGGRGDWDGEYM